MSKNHQAFTVHLTAESPRHAALLLESAAKALQAGTLRLTEERAYGAVSFTWAPGVQALGAPPPQVEAT